MAVAMEVLDTLLKGKERNITTAANEIVSLETRRKEKLKDLWEARKELTDHFQGVALGESDQGEGVPASQKITLLGGEIDGLSKVIDKARKEALWFASKEVKRVEKQRNDLTTRWKKELANTNLEIVQLVKKLRLLIYGIDAKDSDCCDIVQTGFNIAIPFLSADLVCPCRDELKEAVKKVNSGPYFTLKEARAASDWLEKATPESILNDAISTQEQQVGISG